MKLTHFSASENLEEPIIMKIDIPIIYWTRFYIPRHKYNSPNFLYEATRVHFKKHYFDYKCPDKSDIILIW